MVRIGNAPSPHNLISDVSFSEQINRGQSNIKLEYSYSFDDYPQGLKEFNFVRIYDSKARLIYTGFVSQVSPQLSSRKESVSVEVLGLASLFSQMLYKDGSSVEVAKVGIDPSVVITECILQLQTEYPPASGTQWVGTDPVTGIRTGSQVGSVGTNIDYTFSRQTMIKAINQAVELAGGNWFWMIDKGGDFIFKEKPTSPAHEFVIGKHIIDLDITRSVERVKNHCTVTYGDPEAIVVSEDLVSQALYGLREEYQSGKSTDDSVAAQQIADKVIAESKDPETSIVLRIQNGAYDGETIRAGDTCKIKNYNKTFPIFTENMLIHKVSYTQNIVTIELESVRLDAIDSITRLVQNI